jgi:distribution and morphology protein 31
VTTAAASTQNAGIKPSSISDPAPAKSESSDEKGEAESHEIRPYMYEDGLYANYPRSLRELATRAAAAGAAAGASASSLASSSAHASSSSSGSSSRAWTRPKAPSKEELLRLARGFWTRLRIRFKWFTIRGFRRFNVDDLSAFFTLGGLGTIIFLVAGT